MTKFVHNDYQTTMATTMTTMGKLMVVMGFRAKMVGKTEILAENQNFLTIPVIRSGSGLQLRRLLCLYGIREAA